MNRTPRRCARLGVAAVVVTGVVVPMVATAPAAGAGTLVLGKSTKIVVTMRGNGHGHGMSQYGARGAALAGKSYSSILGFYYPGTKLVRLDESRIRVRISGVGRATTIAAWPNTTVTGVRGALPTAGVAKYRLAASGSRSIALQQLKSAKGSTWRNYRTGLPSPASFSRGSKTIRLFDASGGGSNGFYGRMSAVRSGDEVFTVNTVSLDRYTAGVAPREMPASWPAQATNAQAVAARTYGRYAVEHPRGKHYDICDTTMCQVYGGQARYDSRGQRLYTDYPRAAAATSNRVLRYKGRTIFAQFSAANGGYMVSGGQPYLVTKADPYDRSRGGNPYYLYKRTVPVSQVRNYFGLKKLTRIVVTQRDGHGVSNGRAVRGYVDGVSSSGKSRRITVTGSDLQWALGIGTTWFRLRRG